MQSKGARKVIEDDFERRQLVPFSLSAMRAERFFKNCCMMTSQPPYSPNIVQVDIFVSF
jgi:hypothetical protein